MFLLIAFPVLAAAACTGSVGYQPFVPVTFSLDTDGQFSVTTGGGYATPVGIFSADIGVKQDLKDSDTRLILVHRVGGADQQDVFDLHEKGDIALCLDGRFLQSFADNTITIRALDGVSRVDVVSSASGCDGAPTGPSGAPSVVAAESGLAGLWVGSYTCHQGRTGLRLQITSTDDNLSAEFDFYAVPDNPGVPSGSFSMTGTFSRGSLQLRGDHWISWPSGYTMVDLYARSVAAGASTISGDVSSVFPGCTTFRLQRA